MNPLVANRLSRILVEFHPKFRIQSTNTNELCGGLAQFQIEFIKMLSPKIFTRLPRSHIQSKNNKLDFHFALRCNSLALSLFFSVWHSINKLLVREFRISIKNDHWKMFLCQFLWKFSHLNQIVSKYVKRKHPKMEMPN